MLGRLSSVVATELLKGQEVIVVRCEKINISGSLYRNKLKYLKFLRLHMCTNPKRGVHHQRAPSLIFYRCVRGMIPRKTKRGCAALERLSVYEGVPSHLERKKKFLFHKH